jgi:hypothetical protein
MYIADLTLFRVVKKCYKAKKTHKNNKYVSDVSSAPLPAGEIDFAHHVISATSKIAMTTRILF